MIMILNTNQINKLKKLNILPKQEKFRANWNKEDFYGDRYHNCADHYYGLGANYFSRCVRANLGKHVKQVIFILKNNSIYKHRRSFREAVNDSIKSDLIDNIDMTYFRWNEFYVDENGIVQDIKNHPQFPKKEIYSEKPDSIHIDVFLKVENGLTGFIFRSKGIHYYVTERYYKALTKRPWEIFAEYPLISTEEKRKIQLTKSDLKKHGLKNIWE